MYVFRRKCSVAVGESKGVVLPVAAVGCSRVHRKTHGPRENLTAGRAVSLCRDFFVRVSNSDTSRTYVLAWLWYLPKVHPVVPVRRAHWRRKLKDFTPVC